MVQCFLIDMGYRFLNMIYSCIRSASCSHGWLRWLVQVFFGAIMVSSFVLILYMAIRTSSPPAPRPLSSCRVQECRVMCNTASFYDNFEEDIVEAAWQAEDCCDSIKISLKRPYFTNNTLPPNWLSDIRNNVRQLSIVGGNLQYISPLAFTSQFSSNIKTLILENIQLTTWGPETLVGLSSLTQLYIKDCALINITRNALHAVGDTLELLDIKASFQWDPAYVIGSVNLRRLKVVDFALNPFYNVLDKSSFSTLQNCTTLFLNSCKITSLGAGTFNNMYHIQFLYLNDNYLTTIPDGLFDNIMALNPRIAIHDNYWHCDCSNLLFGKIFKKDLLIVEPVCRYPDSVSGLRFSEFYDYCLNRTNPDQTYASPLDRGADQECRIKHFTKYVEITFNCYSNRNISEMPFRIITADDSCLVNDIKSKRDGNFWSNIFDNSTMDQGSDWLHLKYTARSDHRSLMELASLSTPGQGLLWYRTSCPHEIYCLNTMPNVLRIFEEKSIIDYAFCPFNSRSGLVEAQRCVIYNLTDIQTSYSYTIYYGIYGYILMSIICAIGGAVCLYALIHFKPNLLKGNKRILFVKHKEINALILPPDVPIRKGTIADYNFNDNNIYLVSNHKDNSVLSNLERSLSVRSSNSNEVSYISALQPTNEQLAQWRNRESGKKSQYDTLKSDIYKLSSIFDTDSLAYYSLSEIYDAPPEMSKK